jgi:hypothetical protein
MKNGKERSEAAMSPPRYRNKLPSPLHCYEMLPIFGYYLLMILDGFSIPSGRVKQFEENGIYKPSRNVGNKVQSNAV